MFLARRRFTAHTYTLKNTAVKVNRQRRACGSKLVAAFFFLFFLPSLRAFLPRAIFPSLLAMHVASPSNISFAFFLPFFPLLLFFSSLFFLPQRDPARQVRASKRIRSRSSRHIVESLLRLRAGLKAFRRHRHRRETNANTSITRYRGLWLRNERRRLHPGLASRRLFDSEREEPFMIRLTKGTKSSHR